VQHGEEPIQQRRELQIARLALDRVDGVGETEPSALAAECPGGVASVDRREDVLPLPTDLGLAAIEG
jgi:hypothetical protein